MILTIPTSPGVPHYEQETELDGDAYRLTFDWNAREGAWYMAIATPSGTMIRAGIKLVPNWRLLEKVRHASRPPGELLVLDPRGVGITLDNLGLEVELVYVDVESLEEVLGG